ncbi:uncharacterized protein LOC141620625 [Silene latifolia]|uniref:uncharacterized protein LOC141620625 n=1 Tax=Silene latifolia TaxID=37657 RepID=UPI003D7708EB
MAFLPKQQENVDDELVKIGKEIVKKFANVPLAIRDFVIDKQLLISLWMAQGYIRAEDVGEEYFLILLQRCLFQDLEVDELGEIRRAKIHDLLHDIAEQLAGKDICRLSSNGLNVGKTVRHLSLLFEFSPQETFDVTLIRTYMRNGKENALRSVKEVGYILRGSSISNWTCLRSLDLSYLYATSLPESIGELFLLRCLNLSGCDMLSVLPDSITKLVNLLTLDLSDCFYLQELPKNMRKLLDLSTLNLTNCERLIRMPSGLGSLTRLHTLGLFAVGLESLEGKQCSDGLEGLRSMSNLKGFLEVRVSVNNIANYVREDHDEGAYLSNKERLKKIYIKFTCTNFTSDYMGDISFKDRECARVLLEEMQPHHDLKDLKLEGYIGEIMPRWPRREDNLTLFHLPNLVTLNISYCLWLQCLPSLEDLPFLKDLTLVNLPKVEYLVKAKPEASYLGERLSLLPSLQRLFIRDLPNWKGWWPRLVSGLQKKHLVVGLLIAAENTKIYIAKTLPKMQIEDQWNLTDILAKIVKELPSSNTHNITSLEQMHLKIRKQLGGKKYLLVLDDVWTESYHRWQDLENLLEAGASGSRIVVTTRSKKTAQIVADVRVHELQGLREDESWRLFERMAFLPKQLENPDDELIEIGKKIVGMCANVPLAIRVVASLLRGETKLKWLSFCDAELANIRNVDCLILLQRCFFQDLEVDEWGEIKRFKIHDLLHDIAEQVAGKDIYRVRSNALNVGNKVRHIFLSPDFSLPETFNKTHIRTYLKTYKSLIYFPSLDVGYILSSSLSKWAWLRSLDLRKLSAKSLPASIGELSHLRCLNLSLCYSLSVLPDSITKLVNLQTLDLSYCMSLEELPKKLSMLLDLSTLNLTCCKMLRHMPSGMGLFTHLHTLCLFVVGQKSLEDKQYFDALEGLRLMSNLKGPQGTKNCRFAQIERVVAKIGVRPAEEASSNIGTSPLFCSTKASLHK